MGTFKDAGGDRVEVFALSSHLWIDARGCEDSLIKLDAAMARTLAADLLEFADSHDREGNDG